MAVDGLLGTDTNQAAKTGYDDPHRIPGTIYFTDIDASTNVSSDRFTVPLAQTSAIADATLEESGVFDDVLVLQGPVEFDFTLYDAVAGGYRTWGIGPTDISGDGAPGTEQTIGAVNALGGVFTKEVAFSNLGGDPVAPSAGDVWFDGSSLRFNDGLQSMDIWVSARSVLGDVTGTLTSTTVEKIRNVNVEAGAPTDGDVLVYDSSTTQWRHEGGASGAAAIQSDLFIAAGKKLQVGTSCSLRDDRLNLHTNTGVPANLSGGDTWYQEGISIGTLNFRDGKAGATRRVLDDAYAFSGDVTGTPGATVVGDDSHNHSNGTLTGVPGAGIDTGVTNLRGNTIVAGALGTGDRNKSPVWDGSQFQLVHGGWYLIEEVTLSNSQYATFSTNFNGDTFEEIWIIFEGYSAGTGSNTNVYLEPYISPSWYSGASSGYVIRHRKGIDPGVTWYHAVEDVAGMAFGEMYLWGERGWFHGDIVFHTKATYRRGGHGRYHWETYTASGGNQVRAMGWDSEFRFRSSSGVITGIRLNFGGNVYAKARLFALKKYIS